MTVVLMGQMSLDNSVEKSEKKNDQDQFDGIRQEVTKKQKTAKSRVRGKVAEELPNLGRPNPLSTMYGRPRVTSVLKTSLYSLAVLTQIMSIYDRQTDGIAIACTVLAQCQASQPIA